MRRHRDIRPQQVYGVTQRGNQGQWVSLDRQDFRKWKDLMRKCARRYEVRVHGYCLMHSHGHWMFEASTSESISNVMRDMQSQYSRYLNERYREEPWRLICALGTKICPPHLSAYRKTGPVNWTPRFDSESLDSAGFMAFLRYIENSPVSTGMVGGASDWEWSSARAHGAGLDVEEMLDLEQWENLFGKPETIVADWRKFLRVAAEEAPANAAPMARWSTGSAHNRPEGWVRPAVRLSVGGPPG